MSRIRSLLIVILPVSILLIPCGVINAQGRPIITTSNVNQLRVLATLSDADYNRIYSLSWSADNKLLAVGRGSPFIYAAPTFSRVMDNLAVGMYALAFNPVKSTLAIALRSRSSVEGGVGLYNLATGATDYLDQEFVMSLAFSPDGKLLASGSSDGQVNLWEVETLTRLATFNTQTALGPNYLAFSPDGRLLSVVNRGWNIQFWEVAALLRGTVQNPAHVMPIPIVAWGGISNLVFDKTGRDFYFATSETDTTMHPQQWSLATARTSGVNAPLSLDLQQARTESQQLRGYGSIRSLALNPAGDILALASENGQVYLLDARTRTQLRALPINPGANGATAAQHIAFSPDGTMLAIAGEKGPVYVWSIQ